MNPLDSMGGGNRAGMGELRKVLAPFPLQSSCKPSHLLTGRWAWLDWGMLQDSQRYSPLPVGVKSNTVYRTKVTLHSAKLFFKSQMEEPGRRKKIEIITRSQEPG